MKEKIGFIGLGIMGSPMVTNLLKNNLDVMIYDLKVEAYSVLVELGAEVAQSSKEVAQRCSIIYLMLPNDQTIKDTLLGNDGLLENAQEDTLIVCTSSISLVLIEQLTEIFKGYPVELLDAPVSGGESGAISGELAFMIGGKPANLARIELSLKAMGKSYVLVGDIGAGTISKLANQIIVNVNIAAVAEAMILATKYNLNTSKMFEAIRGGLAGSQVLEKKAPLMLEREFKAGGRIDINAKDLKNVTSAAQQSGLDLPLSKQVKEMYDYLIKNNFGSKDHAAIVKFYEDRNQVIVGKDD